MNTRNSPARRLTLRAVMAAFAAVLTALVLGVAGPALASSAGGPDNVHGHGGDHGNSASAHENGNGNANGNANGNGNGNGKGNSTSPDTSDDSTQSAVADSTANASVSDKHGNGQGDAHGPDHSKGNAGTSGDPAHPQPPSDADQNSGGANGQCPGGAYCSTRDGSASANGNGNGAGKGKPCAGCVGQADNKNPHGQRPDGTDHNAGYECDRNHGVGRGNPAHTGCTTPAPPTCPAGQTMHDGHCTVPPQTCPAGTTAQNGVCVSPPQTCPAGSTAHSGQCVITDPPRGCPPGSSIQNGVCVTPPESCPAHTTMVDGHCVAPPRTCGKGATMEHGACVSTSPPTCAAATADPASTAGACTSAPTGSVDPGTDVHVSISAPQAAGPVADTAAPTATTGDLPNTGAPANALLLLLGGLGLLGCGTWVVRRQIG